MAALGTIVVVGASLAGLRAVEALRSRGFDGTLVLIGAERHLPYDRPPLSKEVLRGDWDPARTSLTKPEKFEALSLDLRLGSRAVGLDPSSKRLELDTGESVAYDGLILATGARPLPIPGTPVLDGVHVLRTLDDSMAIAAELDAGPRVVVVGAGFIGAEAAASCRARGLDVTLIEALPVPLGHVLGTELGEACAALHRDQGVELLCGVAVSTFEGHERVERVQLADGRMLDADVVIVGIGVTPEIDWLASSGLDLGDGVLCDATLATSAQGIVAAGDVARWWNPLFEQSMRVEHWTNAAEQGTAAANRLLAGEEGGEVFSSVPFFWSDQYGVNIQFCGWNHPGDRVAIVDGSLADHRFLALYGRGERLTAALAFNRPRQLMTCRRLIREKTSFADAVKLCSSR
ncbi:MAG: FAD/NAD(P)-binding oxidoreductase [Myxococcota bacterium]